MQPSRAALMLLFALAGGSLTAQAPAAASPAQTAPAPPPSGSAAPVSLSSTLQPALNAVQTTLNALHIDKWKRGSVRDEAGEHVSSLLHDMQSNIPPLVAEADAAPGQLSKALPLTKHLDAFYDVLLRVEEASRVSAPSDQITALQQALQTLEQARIAMDNQLQNQAAIQEKQIADLQVALREQKAEAAQEKELVAHAKSEACKPATPARKRRRSTAVKSATPAKSTAPAKTSKPAPGTTKPQ